MTRPDDHEPLPPTLEGIEYFSMANGGLRLRERYVLVDVKLPPQTGSIETSVSWLD